MEYDQSTNPLIKDTDGDGLNDPEDLDPLNASGDGIISGRIFKKAVYDQNGTKQVYFRNAKDADINTTNWEDSWSGEPTTFYLSGKTDGNYTLQAFVDINNDTNYSFGEPFHQKPAILEDGSNAYGINLVPVDPSPVIYFSEDFPDFSDSGLFVTNGEYNSDGQALEQNVTIESNTTNNLSQFEWGVVAEDPLYDNPENNVSSTRELIFEILEGNFSEYLLITEEETTVFEGTTAKFDLGSVPVGKYIFKIHRKR